MRIPRLALAACALALVAACSAPSGLKQEASTEFSGLYRLAGTGFSEAWVRPDAGLENYSAISATPMQSAGAEVIQPGSSVGSRINLDWEMTAERQASLAAAWNHAINNAAAAAGMQSTPPAAQALRIDSRLIRIAPRADFNRVQNASGHVVLLSEYSGEAWVEFRLFDNASAQLLAVFRDRQQLGPGLWHRSNTVTATMDTRNALDTWARRLLSATSANQ